ncbi:hypothetical protein [uncultured Kordia sp.]|uniref:hypothetical protein n=1 Tax=uncultured Kordia sp. TaxID=507699 RepID=UPI00261AA00D|nr:hypothetical protein [uncultured Kordia sp.]
MKTTKSILILILISTIISCQKKQNTIDFNKELTGKSFKIVNSSFDKDIEFLDSIYIIYGLKLTVDKYRIERKNDSISRLFMGNYSAIIQSSNSETYNYIIIEDKQKDTLLLKRNKKKYELNDIIGNWVENTELNYTINKNDILMNIKDSINQKSELNFDKTNKYLTFSLNHSKNRKEYLWKILKIGNDTLFVDKSYKTDKGSTIINNKILTKIR